MKGVGEGGEHVIRAYEGGWFEGCDRSMHLECHQKTWSKEFIGRRTLA